MIPITDRECAAPLEALKRKNNHGKNTWHALWISGLSLVLLYVDDAASINGDLLRLGKDVDMPRNLAKSVTVEYS